MTFQTYNVDIPNAPNNPSQDQPQMKVNTNSINALINQDHYSFNNNLGGTHKQVTLTNESLPSLPAGTNGALFSSLGADGLSWPFWENLVGISPQAVQMLGSNSPATPGYAFLPGGIYLQWGPNGAVSTGSFASGVATGTVTFPKVFPNACFVVLPVPFWTTTSPTSSNAAAVSIDSASKSTTGFNWRFNTPSSSAYTGFFWIAIGN